MVDSILLEGPKISNHQWEMSKLLVVSYDGHSNDIRKTLLISNNFKTL